MRLSLVIVIGIFSSIIKTPTRCEFLSGGRRDCLALSIAVVKKNEITSRLFHSKNWFGREGRAVTGEWNFRRFRLPTGGGRRRRD